MFAPEIANDQKFITVIANPHFETPEVTGVACVADVRETKIEVQFS